MADWFDDIPEFKGDETISRWEQTMEKLIIEMSLACDKSGRQMIIPRNDLLKSFGKAIECIRENQR